MQRTAIDTIEEQRLLEQARLDALKNAEERNRWGQFATPPELARSITRHVLKLMEPGKVRFLDPAIGTGSFYSALRQERPRSGIAGAVGVELDPLFATAAATLWADEGLTIIPGDFTKQAVPEMRFNLVLTNPPYVRHHHLATPDKERLKGQVARSLHLDISGLAGLYCYFFLLSHEWMEEGGIAAWLIPSEFMDVNYGVTLRRYLTDRVTLLQIHRFCPTDVQFTDALVSSAVVIFRKAPPPPGHAARFSFGDAIESPREETMVPVDVLRRSKKWTQFPGKAAVDHASELTLGDLFSIRRGLATGANDFFLVTEEEILQWEIPPQFLKPILPSPRYLTENVVEAFPDGAPAVSPRLYLIDCSEPEERIAATWPRFYAYLQEGRTQNIHASYLTSRRTPWYSQEQRPPAPFLCTYMGRSRNGKQPFRFIWNRSQATAHNVYLMLYPKANLAAALKRNPALAGIIFDALQHITSVQLVSEGRVYGGGLHKVEPNELAHLPATMLLPVLAGHVQTSHQLSMFT